MEFQLLSCNRPIQLIKLVGYSIIDIAQGFSRIQTSNNFCQKNDDQDRIVPHNLQNSLGQIQLTQEIKDENINGYVTRTYHLLQCMVKRMQGCSVW